MSKKNINKKLKTCSQKPNLHQRELISLEQASELMGLFKILASDTRLRMLHSLVREGEMSVTDLADVLGMGVQAISNQLQRLINQGILTSRREGNQIFYSIFDPCIMVLLERGLCHLEEENKRSKNPNKKQIDSLSSDKMLNSRRSKI